MRDRSLYDVLASARRTTELAVVADVKMRSPRDGALIDTGELDCYVDALLAGGVRALSTPTDPVHFAGGLEVAARLRARSDLPLMRKEFFRTVSQIDESVQTGFDAVQLSVNTVPEGQLGPLRDHAERLGLEVVFGVHTLAHLEQALSFKPVAIGLNNRDIVALELDPGSVGVTEEMMKHIPPEVLVLSESSFFTVDDVGRAAAAGAEGVLVGTALAKAKDPAELLRTFREGTRLCPR